MTFEKIIAIVIVFAILAVGNIAQIYLNFKWAASLNRLKFKKNSSVNADKKDMQK